jgi:anti-sigma-K factor RskA
MSERGPDIREILDELEPAEQERLRSIHELLLEAGPPPELPPELAVPPQPSSATVLPFPRYRSTILAAAAAAAVILFGVGYVIGHGRTDEPAFTVAMTGAGGARAELAVFSADPAGNWPMKLQVRGLRPLPGSERYELWLTKRGELVQPCGTFVVTAGETEVPLNAPYRLRSFDGWVVVVEGSERPVLRTATV